MNTFGVRGNLSAGAYPTTSKTGMSWISADLVLLGLLIDLTSPLTSGVERDATIHGMNSGTVKSASLHMLDEGRSSSPLGVYSAESSQ